MFDRASKKLGLEQAVLGTFEKEREDDKPTQKEMEQLLKKGAYALLEDENDEITREFCSDDIESILAKRTRTRVVEGTKTATWLNKQGMLVSKTKFSAESGDAALDMDDPLFWQKVMPDFVTPTIMLQKLNDLTDDIEGTSAKRGPGRGRGRKKKPAEDKNTEGDTEDKAASEAGASQAGADATEDKVVSEADAEVTATPVSNESAEFTEPSGEAVVENGSEVAETADVGDLMADETLEEDLMADETLEEDLMADETMEDLPEEEEGADEAGETNAKTQLSRTNIRKVHKFMSDLKSMMEGIFEETEDDEISGDEKASCQKLLLTISVKEKIFTEEQRRLARMFLKRLEGNRKRRCRTAEQPRFQPGAVDEDDGGGAYIEELMIVGKKRKKRRKRSEMEESGPGKKRRKRNNSSDNLGEDGYLHHSDSEADWSDVGEDLYKPSQKDRISRKESKRRRLWAQGDDPATAAGHPWPAFPRQHVKRVLSTILAEVMKHDDANGGAFSEPVSKDDFPDYYEQIRTPMDYSTMKAKLENGEYRSAQAMQKDFILILQNCRKFNAPTSDIVKEARKQHLLRPASLTKAAAKHDLFLGEDGSVLEIFDEDKKGGEKKKRRRRKKKGDADEAETEADAGDTPDNKKKVRCECTGLIMRQN
jgi:hypothetical protein